MRLLLFLCCIIACLQAAAQKNAVVLPLDTNAGTTIGPLLAKLKSAGNDTGKVNIYNAISDQYYRTNDPANGSAYGQKALELAEQLDWKKGKASALNNLGHNYLIKFEYINALSYYDKALVLYESMGDLAGITKMYTSKGEVYYLLSQYAEAQESYFKALKIAEKQHLAKDIAACQINIGDIYYKERNFPKALEYYNACVKIYTVIDDKRALAIAYRDIANIYFEEVNLSKAAEYYNKALQIAENGHDKKNIAENLSNLGNVYSEQQEHEKALEYAFRSLKLNREINNRSGIANNLGNIGTTYLLIGTDPAALAKIKGPAKNNETIHLQKGIRYINEAVTIELKLGEINTLPQFYENLSEAYSLLGNYKGAYESHINFILFKDSLNNQRRSKEMIGRELEYEFNKQKDSIRAQKAITEERLKQEHRSRKHDQFFYISGIVLIVIVAVFIFRSLRTQQKFNQTISKLVNEQEITIEERTSDLSKSNTKLRALISFNAHQIREPLTRITGAMSVRTYVEPQEYLDEFMPLMEKAAHDLDNAIKDVLEKAQGDG